MIVIMSNSLIDALSGLKGRKQVLAAGNILFRVGDPVSSLFLVSAGALRLTRALPHGAQLTLQRAGPGAILAEASLFAETYRCDASAADDSVLWAVSLRRVRTALRDDPDLAPVLARDLAHELHRARAHAEILSLKTVAERVDAWLALNDGSLPPKGRWRLLASEIGITPEALYREIALRRRSMIR
jgi:CRP/FNR family transcriptional regulator, dissimilatory nitrate respiration regulator